MATTAQLYQLFLNHPIVSTDTRTISEGCLFFALKGDNFDANTFAEKALASGAAFAIIDNAAYKLNDKCIVVPDVLTALQDLAKHHRQQLQIPVIGLTGSNGKTTTKELIRAVLAEKYITFATKGNLNNHIGVPLSVLSLTPDIEIAVIEMGANHQKEIEFLCNIAQPTHGLITNVGMAHLDGFGGFEGVKIGKGELFTYLKEAHGFTFINRNNPYLLEMSQKAGLNKMIYYGTADGNAVKGRLLHTDPFIEFEWEANEQKHLAKANLTGTYNFENILAAITIGDFFGLNANQINKGLADYYPTNNRSQLTKTANNTIICDFYNANPSSMTAALHNLKALSANKKVAIIGDMFELGNEALAQHQMIVNLINELGLTNTIFIGDNFYQHNNIGQGIFFKQPADAANYLKQQHFTDHLILLKGSRGMKLEGLLNYL